MLDQPPKSVKFYWESKKDTIYHIWAKLRDHDKQEPSGQSRLKILCQDGSESERHFRMALSAFPFKSRKRKVKVQGRQPENGEEITLIPLEG